MKLEDVLLGFAVGSGAPVKIPLRHMVVSGQTQEAGKTTTLEALIQRAQLPAIAFITKRGEGSFDGARTLPPYFRERADWQFVCAVLEASMSERLKFERPWIMKASHGALTLADVQQNVQKLQKTARAGMSADIYMTLDKYLDIVVPRVAAITWAPSIDIQAGVNVMDIADRDRFPVELQGLVMRSALEWVYEKQMRTVTIIPEAWEFLPQGRGSPVKLACEQLIRKGAGLQNFVWFDSQDIGGIDKALLRHCPVWLLGVQREANEIDRTLANIPSSVKKPKKAEIALLKRGQFYACWGEHVVKTYVQPAWMSEDDAKRIATFGEEPPAMDRPTPVRAPAPVIPTIEEMLGQKAEALRQKAYDEGFSKAVEIYSERIRSIVDMGRSFVDQLERIREGSDHIGITLVPVENARPLFSADPPPRLPTRKTMPVGSLSAAAARLLCAVARYPDGITWRNACVVACMAYANGFMYRGKKELLDAGLVTEAGDLARISKAGAKLDHAKGAAAAGPLSLREIVSQWSAKLPKPSPEMLELLEASPRESYTTRQFSDLLGRQAGNGFWYGGLSRLRANGLVVDGDIALTEFVRNAKA